MSKTEFLSSLQKGTQNRLNLKLKERKKKGRRKEGKKRKKGRKASKQASRHFLHMAIVVANSCSPCSPHMKEYDCWARLSDLLR